MTSTRHSRRRLLALALAGAAAPRALIGGKRVMAQTTPQTVVYVSNAGDPSISILAMDRKSGDLQLIDKTAIPGTEGPSPTSMPLALSPDHRFLHAALRSEPFMAASFAIDPASGRLNHLGNAPLDASMAYATVDRSGKWLLCASYPQGKLTINPIDGDGHVQAPASQVVSDRPKAHCVLVDQSNKHAYCSVLAQDLILQFDFDAARGAVSPSNPPQIATKKGAGPRHMALHPNGRFLYLITETTATIGAYAVDPTNGTLKELQFVDMMKPGYKGEIAAADLHVTPGGHFLYGSERRTSQLVGFKIDPNKGTLSPIGRWPTETTPRGFGIDPRGFFLLSVGLDSNHMTVYHIRPTGVLDPVKQHPMGKQPNWVEVIDLAA
jgi:6-phosphogluconolactonase